MGLSFFHRSGVSAFSKDSAVIRKELLKHWMNFRTHNRRQIYNPIIMKTRLIEIITTLVKVGLEAGAIRKSWQN